MLRGQDADDVVAVKPSDGPDDSSRCVASSADVDALADALESLGVHHRDSDDDPAGVTPENAEHVRTTVICVEPHQASKVL